jgi:DUF4097 and DUF4098 domain-containing protein YvlB
MKNIKYLLWATTLVFCVLTFYSFSSQAQGNIVAQVDTSYTGIKNVEIKARFCRVEIGAVSNTDKVSFFGDITGNYRKNSYEFKHEKVGNTLKVWLEGKASLRIGFSVVSKSRLMFKIPKGTNVVVQNTSGSVYGVGLNGAITHLAANSGSVKGANLNSPKVYLKTNSGSIKAENVAGNNVEFKSSSGSIRVENVSGKTIVAQSSSGGQRWANVTGEFTTQANSGGIRVAGVKGNTNLRTSSGSIRVANLQGNLKARASSGGVRLNNIQGALSLRSSSGGIKGEGILLTGSSDFESRSGGIRMNFKNDFNTLDFDLRAGSGSLRVAGERSGKRFLNKQGNKILITGISRSGSQKYMPFGSGK